MKTLPKVSIASVLLALTLSACGGSGSDSTSDETSSEGQGTEMEFDEDFELSNPVDVLKKIEGCVLEPGVEKGQQDVDGMYYAECNYESSGASVLVRVVGQQPESYGNEDQSVDDTHKIIYGKDWYANITADPSVFASEISVDAIAEQVGGTVAD